MFSKAFAEYVKTSGNYVVLMSRAPLKMLPYSIHEIYEIITDGKRSDVKQSYHELKKLYGNYPVIENNKIRQVLVEDSNSGYQFFSCLFKRSIVSSADGNGNIVPRLQEMDHTEDTLIIVDGAAFGAMMENCLEYLDAQYEGAVGK